MPQRSGTLLSPEADAFYPSGSPFGVSSILEGWHQQGTRILPQGWQAVKEAEGLLGEVFDLADRVARVNACALPGVNIKYDNFMSCMWLAVSRGYVQQKHALFVSRGLREGFTAGVQLDKLKGKRVYKNYPSAEVEHRAN